MYFVVYPHDASRCFRLLGTPNDDVWPNVTELQDWNPGFPKWKRLSLAHRTQGIDRYGLDLLEVSTVVCFE